MGKKLKKFIELEFNNGETYKSLEKKSGIKAGTLYKMRETETAHDLESYLKAMTFWKQPLEGVVDDEILEQSGYYLGKTGLSRPVHSLDRRREDQLAKKDFRYKDTMVILLALFESQDEIQKGIVYKICKSFEPETRKKEILSNS